MEQDALKNLITEIEEKEKAIFNFKQGEYTTRKDTLQNFKQVATMEERSPAEVAFSYLLKHIQSIGLMVRKKDRRWFWEDENGEGDKQRIVDARNYLLFVFACIEEDERANELDRP